MVYAPGMDPPVEIVNGSCTGLHCTISATFVQETARHARTAWVSHSVRQSTIPVASVVTIQVGLTVEIALMLCLAQQR